MMSTIAEALKKTPLNRVHQALGAKLVPFAGWEMPLQYTKVKQEHQSVREQAGLFDISHMGQIILTAPNIDDVTAFLDGMVPQDISQLYPAKAVYTQLLNEVGGILDDLIIYRLPSDGSFWTAEGEEGYLIICNASNTDLVLDWLNQYKAPEDIEITLVSHQYGLLALQGPLFAEILTAAGWTGHLPKRFHIGFGPLSKIDPALQVGLCRTGYTGEDGVEIIVPYHSLEAVWNGLLRLGQKQGLVPVGLAARDTLRLEAAYPLHGHDIDTTVTPLEAGLGWSVKLGKASDFMGKSALVNQKASGLPQKLYCLTFSQNAIARQFDTVLKAGQPIGTITSGSITPTLNQPIAMAYLKTAANIQIGDTVEVDIRGKMVPAQVVKKPFYVPAPSATIS